MADKLKLEIVTPDKVVLSEEVEYVGLPGIIGQFGVLKNHVPFLSALSIGTLYYRKEDGKNRYVFVSGGFAEVTSDSVTVLAESAERAEDIDTVRARKAKERAERRLREQRENIDIARAQAALQRALYRLATRQKAGLD